MATILEQVDPDMPVHVLAEVADEDEHQELPARPSVTIE